MNYCRQTKLYFWKKDNNSFVLYFFLYLCNWFLKYNFYNIWFWYKFVYNFITNVLYVCKTSSVKCNHFNTLLSFTMFGLLNMDIFCRVSLRFASFIFTLIDLILVYHSRLMVDKNYRAFVIATNKSHYVEKIMFVHNILKL